MRDREPSIEQAPKAANRGFQTLPILSLLLAATLWGLLWYPLRVLEDYGLQGLWTTLFIYLGTLAAALPMMRGRWGEPLAAPWPLALLALASGWTNTAFVLAMLDGQVVRVLLLFYLSPVWATLLGVMVLGEHLTARALAALAVALTGALIMLWEPAVGLPWPQGAADWLALTSGMAFATANVMIRRIQNVSVPAKTTVSWLGAIAVAGLGLLLSGQPLGSPGTPVVAGAVLLGAVGMVIMTLAVQYGVTHMPVHRSAVILLFEVFIGAVSAQLLAGEFVSARELVGGAFVVLAAYVASSKQRVASS